MLLAFLVFAILLLAFLVFAILLLALQFVVFASSSLHLSFVRRDLFLLFLFSCLGNFVSISIVKFCTSFRNSFAFAVLLNFSDSTVSFPSAVLLWNTALILSEFVSSSINSSLRFY